MVGKPDGTRPQGKPGRRWECIIKTGLKEIRWEDIDFINVAHGKGNWPAAVHTVSIQCGDLVA
jgi:hypothetical protein